MFNFDLTDELKFIIQRLSKKDKKRIEILNKKTKQIINSDSFSIQHYKNLRHDLKDFKRVHIDTSFVLVFKVDIQNNHILFVDFSHHDEIYKGFVRSS
ncbi:MAG: addiction module toxin RelE [Candidatus Pacearchaeota archaeon]|jgi:YafQ family addiction module toxin component